MSEPLTTKRKWERTKRWLRGNFPPPCSVRVVLPSLPDSHAETEAVGERRLIIRIHREQSHALRMDSLLHEWAHALTWFGTDDDDHGEEWGIVYARLYQAWLRWDYGRKQKE